MNSKETQQLEELQRYYGLVDTQGRDLFNWVLSGVYHTPRLKVEHIFTKVLLHWLPPKFILPLILDPTQLTPPDAPLILDPTAGLMQMHRLLVKGGGYRWVFGDIDPQVEGVLPMDAMTLSHIYDGRLDGLMVDPPYNRDLSSETKPGIRAYRGNRDFDLTGFFQGLREGAGRTLKPGGRLIVKIGDNHRKVSPKIKEYRFEPWHIHAVNILTEEGFRFLDQVIFQPFRAPPWAPRRRVSMQRHSYFLLFEKVDS